MIEMEKMRVAFEKYRKQTGAKWTNLLLYIINKYPVKFNKLKQVLPDITARTLSATLTSMQKNGLIIKEEDLYTITRLGIIILESTIIHLERIEKK